MALSWLLAERQGEVRQDNISWEHFILLVTQPRANFVSPRQTENVLGVSVTLTTFALLLSATLTPLPGTGNHMSAKSPLGRGTR